MGRAWMRTLYGKGCCTLDLRPPWELRSQHGVHVPAAQAPMFVRNSYEPSGQDLILVTGVWWMPLSVCAQLKLSRAVLWHNKIFTTGPQAKPQGERTDGFEEEGSSGHV